LAVKTVSDQLEKDEKDWTYRRSNFSGGCGTQRLTEDRNDPRSKNGYWYGKVDTFIPRQTTLPVLSTLGTFTNKTGTASAADATTLTEAGAFVAGLYVGFVVTCGGKTMTVTSNTTGVLTGSGGWSGGGSPTPGAYTITLIPSPSETDYVSFAEFCDSTGSRYLYMAKGPNVWRTQATAWTLVHTKAGGQGRQLHVCEGYANILFWAAGGSVNLQYTTDGTTWADYDVFEDWTPRPALAFWTRPLSTGANFRTNAIRSDYIFQATGDPRGTLNPLGSVEPFVGGLFYESSGLSSAWCTAFIPTGSVIHEVVAADGAWFNDHRPGFLDVTAACVYGDELAIVDSGQGPFLWYPGRPVRDISIWRDDGCPPDLKGQIKALITVGSYLLAYWQLDGSDVTMIFWGRINEAGQWTWHYRAGDYTGAHPLGNSGLWMTHGTLATHDRRRLWTCTADGTTCRLYYQDWPHASWNPLMETSSWMQYEDGYRYLYDSWVNLLLMGDQAGALTEIERHGDFTAATKNMTVDYRLDDDSTAEASATWKSLLTINDTRRVQPIHPQRGIQALSSQLKIGLDRTTATLTPVLRDLGLTIERQVRHPVLRRK